MIATDVRSESSNYLSEAATIIASFVEVHGPKRGLHKAAEVAGMKPSRAREMLYRNARRIEAHELLLLRQAEVALNRQRLADMEQKVAALKARLGMEDA